jgi:phosphatidylglycerol:prolipoprotein diacylglycerol transferase
MYPVLFHIGDFTFYSFGLMAALSIIVPALFVSRPLIKKAGVRNDFIYEAIVGTAIGGFVGARIWYLLEHWGTVRHHLWGSLFSGTGFVWYGGLVGGVLTVMVIAHFRKVNLGVLFNAAAPALAIGYAIGRIGCQLAGDGDYGKPSTLPWAMGYPHGTVPTPPGVRVQPTPVYEILAMSVVFWVLWRMAKKDQPPWYVFGWFLVLSAVERFLVEFVRRNPIWFWHLTQPQWVAVGSFVLGVGVILATRRKPVYQVTPRAERPEAADRGSSRATA